MAHEELPIANSNSRILDWVDRSIFPRRAYCRAVKDAFLSVLSGITEAHLDAFLNLSPAVLALRTMDVAVMSRDGDAFLPINTPDRHVPIIIVNTLLWPEQDALEYAVALQVACLISGRFGNGTPQEQAQDQVNRLLRTWGVFSVFDSIHARDCRLRIQLMEGLSGMIVTGLQPYSDDDIEAFRPDWPS